MTAAEGYQRAKQNAINNKGYAVITFMNWKKEYPRHFQGWNPYTNSAHFHNTALGRMLLLRGVE